MNTKNMLVSLGAAIATTKLARTISTIHADDVLGTVGLARRRSYALENLGLFTAGALVGAGAALLFAPASGPETRHRLGRKMGELGDAAGQAVNQVVEKAKRDLPNLESVKPGFHNNGALASERHD
jgi:hypothetical protein